MPDTKVQSPLCLVWDLGRMVAKDEPQKPGCDRAGWPLRDRMIPEVDGESLGAIGSYGE